MEKINAEESQSEQNKVELNKINKSGNGDIFIVTPTIKKAQSLLLKKEPVCSASLAGEIFKSHSSDYVEGKAASVELKDTEKWLPSEVWLEDIKTLFDPVIIKNHESYNDKAALHGRLVIIGLCLLDQELRNQLSEHDIFNALINELRYPFNKILTERGHDLYNPPDSVPNQSDNPLKKRQPTQT